MQYLAILGRQPEFGIVELESQLGSHKVSPFGKSAALLTESPILGRLGGTQKVGRIIYSGPANDLNKLNLPLDQFTFGKSKTNFGLSYYGIKATPRFVTATGLELKKRLKNYGPIRFVAPKNGTELTAAQLKFNQIQIDGFELLVVVNKQEMVVALTEQIQDIDWYSERDYGRPSRSAKVGMLPPKLAQIMLSTTRANQVYDPFCGTGVILQEALLQGRSAIGSDLAPNMVEACRENLEWLDEQRENLPKWSVKLADARTVQFDHRPLAIVSEGYLGPPMTKAPSKATLQLLKPDTERLYIDSLKNWATYLEKGSEVAITVPVWSSNHQQTSLAIVDRLGDLGYTLKVFKHVDSTKLTYRRPNQIVGRQLLLLTRS